MKQPVAALQSAQYVEVRRRIFRQLVESLIYEGLLPAQQIQIEGEPGFVIEGRSERCEVVTYSARGQRKLTFGRIRLNRYAPILRQTGGEIAEADSLAQFLLDVRQALGADASRLTQFIHELEQTHLKDTLAQHYRHQAGLAQYGSAYDEWEGDVMDGHPYHPSYKSRIGFDYADNYRYGPEFKPELYPIWVAADKEFAHLAISERLEYSEFLRQELGEETIRAFADVVRTAGKNPEDFVLLPVHSWQWQRHIVTACMDDLREKRLIRVGRSPDAFRPQQSIRTLANASQPDRSYLKLAMSLINTSTGRTLAPHTVQNAPLVTDWLQRLAADDAFFRDELRTVLLGEVMGISYDPPPRAELLQAKTAGILGCIWRESLHPHLEAGEEAVPYNALTSLDVNGRPIIELWVQKFGAIPWLRQLFAVSVLPLAHFLYAHGIALETHAQNAVLLHEQGRPTRIALKDFHDGIRFCRSFLTQPELCPPLHRTPDAHARVNANSFVETDELGLVRDFMHDAFFFINIGELALLMDEFYGVEEAAFWALVRDVLEQYQQRFPELRERFELFDLFAPTIEVEQLTKRRLYPDTELRMHAVPNPLRRGV
ncbi:IucA/IucC family protein [Tumebacillus permanentifrigoris]|uniref:Siderophore synthetase component n=1 Tax=Tumebacillus permanentifrigoris TaxID=378543 RepID=A0A316DAD3_9BACL|nr:IucA/IucC family protein [Tumebacillus permanentifrigoris]PWK09622.1 siderophore synthetase component [Tumebacillus permanentifrigoris]